ncbi:putative GTP-binding protein [Vibrio phage H188]|nr:putative GTP-binding protein [Vibrio phage H188]
MKTIIAGGRDFNDLEVATLAIKTVYPTIYITEVVCGMARGADTVGKDWAEKFSIKVKEFPADWSNNGKAAGPIRNREMGDYADALICFWDGKSRGTKNMIDYAFFIGITVFIFNYDGLRIDAEGEPC